MYFSSGTPHPGRKRQRKEEFKMLALEGFLFSSASYISASYVTYPAVFRVGHGSSMLYGLFKSVLSSITAIGYDCRINVLPTSP